MCFSFCCCCCFCLTLAFSLSHPPSLPSSSSLRLSHPGLLSWLALVWLYFPPHACGGARLSCIVASRLAQNWHFSCAQKTYGEAFGWCAPVLFSHPYMHLCTHKILNTPPPPQSNPGDADSHSSTFSHSLHRHCVSVWLLCFPGCLFCFCSLFFLYMCWTFKLSVRH